MKFYGEGLAGVEDRRYAGKLIVVEGPDGVGRTTQVDMLRTWLESTGYAVAATGNLRSPLVGPGIQQAKEGHSLGRLTMTLFYATDFADRLENQIVPALRAGFVVLADRYMFSAIARAEARGLDPQWIRDLYGMALMPDAIFYLRPSTVDVLVQRNLIRGGLDYWESGMDIHFGDNLYDSFVVYQTRMMEAFGRMAETYGFETLDADEDPEKIFAVLRRRVNQLLKQ